MVALMLLKNRGWNLVSRNRVASKLATFSKPVPVIVDSFRLKMPQTELFWAILADAHPLEELKKVDLEGFDWGGLSAAGQTLLVTFIGETLADNKKHEDALKTIEWLICSGASIEQKCTGGFWSLFWPDRPEMPRIRVDCKGLSAISFVQALQGQMREYLEDWADQEAFLVRVMSRFVTASSLNAARPRVPIHEGVVELWEKSLAAKDSHDLTIETAEGLVTAHAHMLKAASSVVTAMLESPMKEGKAQRIEVKDTSGKAVSLLLEILYTCSAQEDPDHQTALGALDLAHRWQVEVVVAILTDLLAGMITDESFTTIGEHAVLKGLDRLKTAAKNFGAGSAKVQADLGLGDSMARLISKRAASLLPCCNSSLRPQSHRSPTSPSRSAAGCDAFGVLKVLQRREDKDTGSIYVDPTAGTNLEQ
eukprot:s1389_g22.t1